MAAKQKTLSRNLKPNTHPSDTDLFLLGLIFPAIFFFPNYLIFVGIFLLAILAYHDYLNFLLPASLVHRYLILGFLYSIIVIWTTDIDIFLFLLSILSSFVIGGVYYLTKFFAFGDFLVMAGLGLWMHTIVFKAIFFIYIISLLFFVLKFLKGKIKPFNKQQHVAFVPYIFFAVICAIIANFIFP